MDTCIIMNLERKLKKRLDTRVRLSIRKEITTCPCKRRKFIENKLNNKAQGKKAVKEERDEFIGKFTHSKVTEGGNGKLLKRLLYSFDLVATNTFYKLDKWNKDNN